MSVFHDEVEIEDFEYDEETETYYYPCPCGDQFEITKVYCVTVSLFPLVRENSISQGRLFFSCALRTQ